MSRRAARSEVLGAEITVRAEAWLANDPDPETRGELSALLERVSLGDHAAAAEVAARFNGRLEFGTAGLRGELGAGSARMNRVVVAQAAAGFAAFLLSRGSSGSSGRSPGSGRSGSSVGRAVPPSVVIGYDGRKNSDVFARDTAEILTGAGVTATLLPRALPTPVLAFAVRHLAADSGVMVTASHNPPRDNGYKVYLGGRDQGSQIVSPADTQIAERIAEVAAVSVLDLPRSDEYSVAGDDIVADYVRLTAAVAGSPGRRAQQPRVVYTALHGVGWDLVRRVFATAGFAEPVVVVEQAAPDPAFPTVAFPNPEEPGAMDLSIATAARVRADLILANDPDADRLAVAIPLGDPGDPASWRRLSGNDVGALLGWRAAERLRASGSRGTLVASVVSSPALREVAATYGLPFVDTLTGFKWVSRIEDLAYGYEEALGYLVDPAKVRDKDGISAAVDIVALVAELVASGSTLANHLADFDARFGAFASSQVSVRVEDTAEIARITTAFRSSPPRTIGGHKVDRVDDFSLGFEAFPASDILRIWLRGDAAHGGSRVIVRPSGTEPKLKFYLDAWSSVGDAAAPRAAAEAVVATLDAGVRELLR